MTSTSSPAITTCLLISDFNAGNLKSYLENDAAEPVVQVASYWVCLRTSINRTQRYPQPDHCAMMKSGG